MGKKSLTPCLLWKQARNRLGMSRAATYLFFYGGGRRRDKVEPVRKSRRSLQYRSHSYVQGFF